jgi:hypothetical protein
MIKDYYLQAAKHFWSWQRKAMYSPLTTAAKYPYYKVKAE